MSGVEGIEVVAALDPGAQGAVGRLLERAAAEDGKAAVSEQGRLALRGPREGVRHLLQHDDAGGLVGYAQVDGEGTAELVVDPARRGRGHGRELASAAASAGARRVWAHGGHPAARRLAEAFGLVLSRELRQMRRALPVDVEPVLPPGVTLRTFVPGQDDAAWLALNAAAFAHHPEQGSWTQRDLSERIAEPWFDPAGFFLAERGGRLVGFHWTKAEGGLGEVYVVGVSPQEQGSGLGRALTATGLRYLGEVRGLHTVLLYVDADNPAAVRVYERLGFTVHEVDLVFSAPADDVLPR
ncbi:mycothiol synthase [Streptacidiphilus sp. PB12-B1b]|uniref:mycothiol synthase n=1 Tax=Streptacidiphilus sp. PB12-B1b TaxID=2705012 RepID=UPI0015FDEB38|nr:mycothiol synthase [Streptacidiphilus sp. PB12-B1b]QMU79635.1 mycothiol synthase [Streptacidiphilus sp. PB12-B1b]